MCLDGHMLRKEPSSIVHQTLRWSGQDKKNQERRHTAWRRPTVAEIQWLGLSWSQSDKNETQRKDRQKSTKTITRSEKITVGLTEIPKRA
ncbi:hypothetical protein ACROYT_G025545 [Oculina patagonica]